MPEPKEQSKTVPTLLTSSPLYIERDLNALQPNR